MSNENEISPVILDAERFIEADLRLEKVVCLGLQPYLALSDDAEEMLMDVDEIIKQTGIEVVLDDRDDRDDPDWIHELLMARGFDKFFVLISHVRMGNGWGSFDSRWFYADTIEAAIQAAIAHEWPKPKEVAG